MTTTDKMRETRREYTDDQHAAIMRAAAEEIRQLTACKVQLLEACKMLLGEGSDNRRCLSGRDDCECRFCFARAAIAADEKK